MKWLADLPQVLESQVWDWDDVLKQAKQANCYSALLLGLALAHQLFAWQPPTVVREALCRSAFLNRQLNTVTQNLNKSTHDITTLNVKQKFQHILYRISLFESLVFAWNEVRFYFLSAYDLKVVRLPDRVFPLYYCLRPVLIWVEIFKKKWG